MEKNHKSIPYCCGRTLIPGFLIFAAVTLIILTGCAHISGNRAYSLVDLKTDIYEARTEIINGYRGYPGKVVKISPINGVNWADFSRSIYWDWTLEENGYQEITVTMSVLAESPNTNRPVISAYKPEQRAWSNPTNIKWNGPANIGWTYQCGDDLYGQFGGKPVEIPMNKWVDLTFIQSIDVTGTTEGQIYIDGKNTNYGLLDLTLYVRDFRVTMRPNNKFIALTFNDSPTDFTYVLISKLDEYDVKGTFFVLGMGADAMHPLQDRILTAADRMNSAADRKETLKWIFDDGHELANHLYSHVSVLPNPLTDEAVRAELEKNQAVIQRAVYGDDYQKFPMVSKFSRNPVNNTSANTVFMRSSYGINLPVISGLNMSDPAKTAEEIVESMYRRIEPWSVLILGDPRTDPAVLKTLDILIPRLKADGYIFVTLSDMALKRRTTLRAGRIYSNLDPDRY